MHNGAPDTYCFFQEIAPRAPMVARFDRDYLLHAVSGALRVNVDGKRWVLPPSFAAWVPADTEMTVQLDRPVTSCSILVKPGLNHGFPDHSVAFQMTRMTRDMAWHCRAWGKDAAHPPEAKVFFEALLSTCVTLVQGSINVSRPSSDDPNLSQAIAYTEERLAQPLTAQDVAEASGMSERTMQRRFAAELGMSWGQTLKQIRMIRAVELLALEELSVLQVAGACGYDAMSSFNANFKAYVGMTPTEFRRKLR
ncbi:MAG: AraC family transcriptional regulator [Pseudomonadota bacterium]